jgi:hypothetical protein
MKNQPILSNSLRALREKTAQLQIVGKPVGAIVSVNGKTIGPLPLDKPVPVARGRVEVSLRSDGYTSRSVSIVLTARNPEPVVLELIQQSGSPKQFLVAPAVSIKDPSGISPVIQSTSTLIPRRSDPPDAIEVADGGSSRRTLITAGAMGSGALLAGGAVALILREQKASEFNGSCAFKSGNVTDPGGGPASQRCFDLKAQIDTRQTIAIAGFIGGGVLATASLILWLTEPRRESQAARAHAFQCVPASLGAACRFRF